MGEETQGHMYPGPSSALSIQTWMWGQGCDYWIDVPVWRQEARGKEAPCSIILLDIHMGRGNCDGTSCWKRELAPALEAQAREMEGKMYFRQRGSSRESVG